MKNLVLVLGVLFGVAALASCAEDGVYSSAYSTGPNDYYSSSTYAPSEMNAGYNRSYYKSKQKQKIVEPVQQTSSVTSSVSTTTSSAGASYENSPHGNSYSSSSN